MIPNLNHLGVGLSVTLLPGASQKAGDALFLPRHSVDDSAVELNRGANAGFFLDIASCDHRHKDR